MSFTSTLNRQIFKLTIPNIITNITVPLLGMVDTAIVGHISSGGMQDKYISAIAIGAMMFNVIYWLFGFLRMGTSGFTAQAFGNKDKEKQIDILLRSCSIAISFALLLIVLQRPIAWLCKEFIDGEPMIIDFALQYFYIRIWAAPATLGMYSLKGWMIGMQDSKTPMFVAIMINVVNIVLDLLFVVVFKMNIAGVAYATLIAQYSGLLTIVLIFVVKYYKRYRVNFKRALRRKEMSRFFRVNGDIFLRTLCIIAVTSYFTAASSKMGGTVLAVNTLIMQLFHLFSYFMDGFAYAAESLCGKFVGAKDSVSLRKVVKLIVIWGALITATCMIVYGLFAKDILSLLTNKQELIQASEEFLFWTILIPLTGFLAFVYDGILIGMIKTVLMRNAIFWASAAFFAVFFVFGRTNNALWAGFICYLLLRSVLMTVLSWKEIFKQTL